MVSLETAALNTFHLKLPYLCICEHTYSTSVTATRT